MLMLKPRCAMARTTDSGQKSSGGAPLMMYVHKRFTLWVRRGSEDMNRRTLKGIKRYHWQLRETSNTDGNTVTTGS